MNENNPLKGDCRETELGTVYFADTHVTPCVKYQSQELGRAKVTHENYKEGFYRFEGMYGIDFWHISQPLSYTSLNIAGKETMIDDPLHWWGTKLYIDNLAEAMKGTKGVLVCGGLGLGLMIYHAAENPLIKKIIIVEQEADVINLIMPKLQQQNPNDVLRAKAVEVINDDFYYAAPALGADAIYWDLAVGGRSDTAPPINNAQIFLRVRCPNIPFSLFGAMRNKKGEPTKTVFLNKLRQQPERRRAEKMRIGEYVFDDD